MGGSWHGVAEHGRDGQLLARCQRGWTALIGKGDVVLMLEGEIGIRKEEIKAEW